MKLKYPIAIIFSLLAFTYTANAFAGGWNPDSKAPNHTSVANTRHNLTQSFSDLDWFMDSFRNNYGEVCVFCHTPHGANSAANMPLWNHTLSSVTYTTYGQTTSGQLAGLPGPNSVMCLSCHDGTVAIDSIINMPKSGGYLAAQDSTIDYGFLDTWSGGQNHFPLVGNPGIGRPPGEGCDNCHHDSAVFDAMSDFQDFNIGSDLRDEHPIGVELPSSDPYYAEPNATLPEGGMAFFDLDGDSRPDANEIRLYDTGDGNKVECGSCHDPHGISSGGQGSLFIASFLRVDNTQSLLCYTCHDK
jgi:hypothetical protein